MRQRTNLKRKDNPEKLQCKSDRDAGLNSIEIPDSMRKFKNGLFVNVTESKRNLKWFFNPKLKSKCLRLNLAP